MRGLRPAAGVCAEAINGNPVSTAAARRARVAYFMGFGFVLFWVTDLTVLELTDATWGFYGRPSNGVNG